MADRSGKGSVRLKAERKGRHEISMRMIGVVGAGRSVGVTHFAIMTAGYLSGILRRRCAVLEWNRHDGFHRMELICCKSLKKGGTCSAGANDATDTNPRYSLLSVRPFQILEVDYFGRAGMNELLLCKTCGYQDVIVDYGSLEDGNLQEFLRCDRQFVIGSLSEWQLEAFLEFVGQRGKAKNSWEALAVFGSEETRKNIEKRLGITVWRIPVSVDAFTVTEEVMKFYDRIL